MEKKEAVFKDPSIYKGAVFHIKHLESISDGKKVEARNNQYDLFLTAQEDRLIKICNVPGKYLLCWQDGKNCEHLETFYLK